jgi:hypothetical protein
MKFELNEWQIGKFNEWKTHIKGVFGEYGHFTFSFTSNGIGYGVVVYSHLAKTELDLTDVDSF